MVANLFLGHEEVSGVRLLDETDMEQQAAEVLRRLAVRIPSVRTQVASLSGGQRQSVAIARSLLGKPRVVLLDEPTAALGVAQTAQVLDLIRTLRDQRLAVVVISHNLADVFAVADRIVVLRLGRQVGRHGRQADQLGVRSWPPSPGPDAGDEQPAEVPESMTVSELDPRLIADQPGLAGAWASFRRRLGQGELGSLPVLVGVAVIWAIFAIANPNFLTPGNLTNLVLQLAATGTISLGVVLVLLLGEIDLSVGAVSGVTAAVMAVLNVDHGVAGWLAILIGLARRRGHRRPPGVLGDPVPHPGVRCHPGRPAGLDRGAAPGARRYRHGEPDRPHHRRPGQHLLHPAVRLAAGAAGGRRVRGGQAVGAAPAGRGRAPDPAAADDRDPDGGPHRRVPWPPPRCSPPTGACRSRW